jgi:hypothetical protein
MRAARFAPPIAVAAMLAGAAILAGAAAPASASLVLDLAGGSSAAAFTGTAGTAGWQFTVNANITLEGLGLWDEGADGLHAPHAVGLWTHSGALLESVIVNNASTPVASSSGLGQWLFTKISPLFLTRGTYVLGGYYEDNDPDRVRVLTSAATGAQMTFGTALTIATPPGALEFPTQADSAQNDGVFGPNIFIASATSEPPVPEPASVVAWSLGGACAMGIAARRRRHA